MISDFGECQLIDALDIRTGATGTLEFLAPEMLMKDCDGRWLPSSSTKGDIWSLGVVLYFLCYSKVPYKSTQVDDLKREIIEFDVDKLEFQECQRVDQQVIDLIKILMAYDRVKRPGIEEVVDIVKSFQPRKRSRSMSATTVTGMSISLPKSQSGCTSMVCHSPGNECTSIVPRQSPILASLSPLTESPQALVTRGFALNNTTEMVPLLEKEGKVNDAILKREGIKLQSELCLIFLPLLPMLFFETPQVLLTLGSCLAGLLGIVYQPVWKFIAGAWVLVIVLARLMIWL